MSRFLIAVLSVVVGCLPSFALESNGDGFFDHGVGKLIKQADDILKDMEHSGIDTAYVKVPERDRMVYIGGYTSQQRYNLYFPIMLHNDDYPALLQNYLPSNMSELMSMEPHFRASQSDIELGVDWRGLCVELPISLKDNYTKSFGIAKNGTVWGFRVKYKSVKNLSGTIHDPFMQATDEMVVRYFMDLLNYGEERENHDPVITVEREIEDGSMDLKTFYAEGYYVFNHRKFSLGAGLYGDMIQRKSAGSLIAMANFFQSRLGCNYMLAADRDVFRNQIFSIGLGYGYNLSLMDGRMCVHASVIPMFSLHNHVFHKTVNPYVDAGFDDEDLAPDEKAELDAAFERFYRHFYDGANVARDSGFKVNAFARLAVNYSFDRYIVTALANYRHYLFGSSSGMSIKNQEADLQINFGYRF